MNGENIGLHGGPGRALMIEGGNRTLVCNLCIIIYYFVFGFCFCFFMGAVENINVIAVTKLNILMYYFD